MTISRLAVAAVFTLALGAVPSSAAKRKVTWLLAHENIDYFRDAADHFKKIVEEGTKGELEVSIVVAGRTEDGSPASPERDVASGKAEMGHSFADSVGGVDPRFLVFEAPYLMRDYRHMEGVIEGKPGAELLGGLRKQGLVGLALTYSGGASGVATTGRELRRPADLKGLKVGVYGDAVDTAWLERLGATPVPLRHALRRISPMARAGELDAVAVTWRNFEVEKLEHDFRTMNLVGSTYLVSVTYANEKFFESLPKEWRELIVKASAETARIERAKTIELNATAKRAMLAKGVRSVHLARDGRRAFEAALKPAYDAEIAPLVGRGLLDLVRSAKDGEPLFTSALEFASR